MRRGFSLMEVLAAIGVIAIGLLGLASLMPIGQIMIFQGTQADRAGNCGRAAMRDVVVRRMLDSTNWTKNPTTPAFLIDPIGVTGGYQNANGPTGPLANINFGGTTIPRVSLKNNGTAMVGLQAASTFTCTDDLVAPLPENFTPAQPVGRPVNMVGGNPSPLDYRGDYTWFASVVPQPNSSRFTVSVVVCYKRLVDTVAREHSNTNNPVIVSSLHDSVNGVALAGGSVQLNAALNDPANGISVHENDWVALCSSAGLCRWYRIAAISDDTTQLTLVGPDWVNPSPGSDKVVALASNVVGVYTTTIDLDTDPTWKN